MARLKSKGLMQLIKDYVDPKLLKSLGLWWQTFLSIAAGWSSEVRAVWPNSPWCLDCPYHCASNGS